VFITPFDRELTIPLAAAMSAVSYFVLRRFF